MERSDKDQFLVIHDFMLRHLGLKGVQLLLYARIYGFCQGGTTCGFYESRAKTAEALCVSERSVIQAFKDLSARGLIVEIGTRETANGRVTKCYRISEVSSPERPSGEDHCSESEETGEKTSPGGVKKLHPIKKEDNKRGKNSLRDADFSEYDR